MDKIATRAISEVSVSRIIGVFGFQCLRMGADVKASLRALKTSCNDSL